MRLLVYTVAAVFGVFGNLPSARSEIPREIPFQFRDGLIWLKAEVAGKGEPLNFILDSGAGVSVLDLTRVCALGIRVGNPETIQGVDGRAVAYRVDNFEAVSAGVALPRSFLAANLKAVSNSCHQPIDGILGVDFFRGRIVQIDFREHKVRLCKNCDINLANCDVLPIRMCNGAFCVPMRIADNPVQWMRLDTGCDSALEWVVRGVETSQMSGHSIALSAAAAHHIKTSGQIGKHSFNDITAGVHTKQIFSGEDGLLGNGLLSKFCLTIDERRRRAVFEMTR
jgi:hypothetical protein